MDNFLGISYYKPFTLINDKLEFKNIRISRFDFILNTYNNGELRIKNPNDTITIGESNLYFNISIQQTGNQYIDKLCAVLNQDAKICDNESLKKREAYVVKPIVLKGTNFDEEIALYIFYYKNSTIIFKAEIDSKYITISNMKDVDPLESYIKSKQYKINWCDEVYRNVNEIFEHIIKKINSDYLIKLDDRGFYSLRLIKFGEQPRKLSEAKKKEMNNLYKIINAPTNEIATFNLESKRLYENQYWSNDVFDSFRYYFSTTGKCVYITSEEYFNKLYEYIENELMYYYENNKEDEFLIDEILDMISLQIDYTVDIVLQLIMLKRLNIRNTIELMQEGKISNSSIKRLYYKNIDFLNSFLLNSYGSLLDLYNGANDIMKWYLNEGLLIQKLDALESIDNIEKNIRDIKRDERDKERYKVEKEKEEKEKNASKKIEKLGFLVVFIFGLPVINDMLYIIRGLFPAHDMLPGKLEVYSLVLWIISVLITFIFLNINSKLNKKIYRITNIIKSKFSNSKKKL